MEMSLILLILGFIVVVFLIFKFIKKLVFAVITLVFFVIIIIGSVFGLAYLDYSHLTSQNDYTVDVVYLKDNEYSLGLRVPIVNGNPDINKVESISKTELEDLKPENIENEDARFVIVITEELYNKLLENADVYQMSDEESSSFGQFELNLSIESDQAKDITESPDPKEELKDVIIENNDFSNAEEVLADPIIDSYIEKSLEEVGIDANEAMFAVVIQQSLEEQENIITIVEAFKEEDLEIYPQRFTFTLAKNIVPIGTIKSFLLDEESLE